MEAGGGGGAGAGIGGNGGKGGNGSQTQATNLGHKIEFETIPSKDASNPINNTNSGFDGENGKDCGLITINENLKVYAYGGNGGSGGDGIASSGGGGGGYPAAGIGRRRSWRWTAEIIMMEQVDIQELVDKIILIQDIMD